MSYNTWYSVMQWDAMDKQYVELVKRPHKHLCYEYIQKSNLRNAKVVAYYWQEKQMNEKDIALMFFGIEADENDDLSEITEMMK